MPLKTFLPAFFMLFDRLAPARKDELHSADISLAALRDFGGESRTEFRAASEGESGS